jgi:hypothetical protein
MEAESKSTTERIKSNLANADEFQRLFNVRYSGHPTLFCVIPKPLICNGSRPLEQFRGLIRVGESALLELGCPVDEVVHAVLDVEAVGLRVPHPPCRDHPLQVH